MVSTLRGMPVIKYVLRVTIVNRLAFQAIRISSELVGRGKLSLSIAALRAHWRPTAVAHAIRFSLFSPTLQPPIGDGGARARARVFSFAAIFCLAWLLS